MTEQPDTPLAGGTVAAFATTTVPLADIDALRPKAGSIGGKPVPLKLLKYADEQTVAGIAAVCQAIQDREWGDRSFRDWGAVGAPRFLGRMAVAMTVAKYLQDHAYSVSPHIIPNQSLHAVSGTLSLALALQGPHFGVGGGHNAVPEGLLTALNVLHEYHLPGVWLVLTEFDPEPLPDEQGSCTNAVAVHAVALALEAGTDGAVLRLMRTPAATSVPATVRELSEYLNGPRAKPWTCGVAGLGVLKLTI